MTAPENPVARLEGSIAALEAQRGILGDPVVDAAVGALRAQLAALVPSARAHDDADGERRIVTVMFADLSGFTALGETLDAEHLRATMNACFSRLTPVIHRYGGTIDKFVGDEIMALFGAPVAHEDDPDRALRAALEMIEEIAALNRETGTALGLHFGINTGAVVAGGIGDERRRDYSVMGDAVNLAARLEGLSRDGEILVGPETFRLTSKRFEYAEPRQVALQGKAALVTVYRLVGLKDTGELSPGAGDARAPLVGRARELDTLIGLVRSLEAGAGGLVAIRGDAGVGKSRLLAEIRGALRGDVEWAQGSARSYAQGISYAMARTLLYSLLGVRAEDSLARIDEALQGSIARTRPERLVDIYPYLAWLLDLRVGEAFGEALKPLPPEVLQARTLRAFAEYLRARAARQAMLVACEDLHSADPSSLQLLMSLLPLAGEVPLLFVVTYRRDPASEEFHRQAAAAFGPRYTVLDLQPLSAEDSHALVSRLLRSRELSPALTAVLDRAEGNPFFLEELLRSLTDAAALVADADGTLSVRATDALAVPATVQGVIMARIDRLVAESKTTLQTASVIGREFSRDVLARISADGPASAAVAPALRDLESREFIRARTATTIAEFAFRHGVTQDVAYNSLLLSRRRRLHEAAGVAMEALFPDRLDELAGELAHHYRIAGRRDKAVMYFGLAADRARRGFANAEAVVFYRAALEELAGAPGAADGGAAPALQERLGDVLELMGRHEEARAAYEQALAASGSDAVGSATRRHKWALSLVVQRRYDEALTGYALAEETLEAARLEAPPGAWWRVWLQIQLGRMWVYYWQNRSGDSDALAARIRSSVEAEGTPSQRAEFFIQRALSHLRRDRYVASDAAVMYAAEARNAIRQVDSVADLPHFLFVVGFTHLWRNDLDEAERALSESLRVAERVGDSVIELRCRTYLGLVARKRGAVAGAREIFQRVLDLASAARMHEYIAMAKAGLAWAAWREGHAAEAESGAREALDAWHAMPVPYSFDWMAAWILVAARLAQGDGAGAIRNAELMLRPEQQPLPDPLARLTSAAVRAWAEGDSTGAAARLQDAVRLAAGTGHL